MANPFDSLTLHLAKMPDGGHSLSGVKFHWRRAISASWDNTLKVWGLESGAALVTFSGDCYFSTCAVTPDDRTLVAGGEYGWVHFLRLEEPE